MASSSSSLVPVVIFLSLALFMFISQAALPADIDQSIAAVRNCINAVKSVKGQKQVVDTCIEVLNNSIDNLRQTAAAAKAGKKDDAKTRASAALTDVDTCEDEFGRSEPAPVKSALAAASASISKVLAGI